jgi:hypothetical protein
LTVDIVLQDSVYAKLPVGKLPFGINNNSNLTLFEKMHNGHCYMYTLLQVRKMPHPHIHIRHFRIWNHYIRKIQLRHPIIVPFAMHCQLTDFLLFDGSYVPFGTYDSNGHL